jgi:hypothetical protein
MKIKRAKYSILLRRISVNYVPADPWVVIHSFILIAEP